MTDLPEPISVRAYAKHRGVTPRAVRKAILAERLSASVTRNDQGHPKISDVELADREWTAGSRPSANDENTADESSGYSGHRTRKESALADLAEIKLAERRGQVVDADEVGNEWASQVIAVKTKLLGVSTRLQQQVPDVSSIVSGAVDALIREALEELADGR